MPVNKTVASQIASPGSASPAVQDRSDGNAQIIPTSDAAQVRCKRSETSVGHKLECFSTKLMKPVRAFRDFIRRLLNRVRCTVVGGGNKPQEIIEQKMRAVLTPPCSSMAGVRAKDFADALFECAKQSESEEPYNDDRGRDDVIEGRKNFVAGQWKGPLNELNSRQAKSILDHLKRSDTGSLGFWFNMGINLQKDINRNNDRVYLRWQVVEALKKELIRALDEKIRVRMDERVAPYCTRPLSPAPIPD